MATKTLIKTFLGLVLCFSGIVAVYFFLDGLANGANFILLAGAFVLIAIGVFCLIKAGKSDALGVKKITSKPMVPKEGGQNLLERNNSLLGDWKKTTDARDRLKLLESAQEKNVL